MRALVWRAAWVVLAEMLVEDGLEGEALATNMAVEGLVSRVLANVVLQLVLACVLLSTHATHKGRDAHVKSHVTIKAALLVKGLAAVNTGETRVVAEPAITHLLTQILLIPSHIKHCCFLSLQSRKKNELIPCTCSLNCTGTGAFHVLNLVVWHFNNNELAENNKAKEQRQDAFKEHRVDEECILN